MEPLTARRTWRALEPVHGMIYFAPEATERYEALGLGGRSGYFASRSAGFGDVPPAVVVAAFFSFRPSVVVEALAGVWQVTTPEEVAAARREAAGAALARVLGGGAAGADVVEAAGLARRVAEAAADHIGGRPVFAAHASLPWPDDPATVLWHAQTLLREFRGDGHVAALVAEGMSGLDASVLHVATGEMPLAGARASRGWTDAEWEAAMASLVARGFLGPGEGLVLTDEGRRHRQWVEDRTDLAAAPPYAAIGEDGCERLRALGRPISRAVIDAGLLPFATRD